MPLPSSTFSWLPSRSIPHHHQDYSAQRSQRYFCCVQQFFRLSRILQTSSCFYNSLLCVFYIFAVRSTPPIFVFEDQLTEHPSCSSLKAPLANTNPSAPVLSISPPACCWRRADWLLRDSPYSEGVAEHRLSSTCWDCRTFQGDLSGKLQVRRTAGGLARLADLTGCCVYVHAHVYISLWVCMSVRVYLSSPQRASPLWMTSRLVTSHASASSPT